MHPLGRLFCARLHRHIGGLEKGKLEGKNTKLQQKGEGEERRETLQRRQQEGDQLKRPKEAKAGAGAAATITKHYNIMHSLFNAISV